MLSFVLLLLAGLAVDDLFAAAAGHVPGGASLLDAGCGEGSLLARLPAGVAYWGVDASAEAIEAARRLHRGRPNARFERGDLRSAHLGIGRFDAVAFLNMLGEEGLDGARALRKLRAALRPGGRLLVGGTERGWSLEGVLALLKHLGFGAPREVARRAPSYLIVVER